MAKINIPLQEVDYKKIHLVKGDCLAVKKPKAMDDYDWTAALARLADDVQKHVGISTIIFGVERKLSEISKVSEEQMDHYGWVRKERVFAYTDEVYEDVARKYEKLAREYHASMTEGEE